MSVVHSCPPRIIIIKSPFPDSHSKIYLGHQEPIRRAEVEAKKAIVNTKLVETLAEVGVLVNKLARGCYLCNDE